MGLQEFEAEIYTLELELFLLKPRQKQSESKFCENGIIGVLQTIVVPQMPFNLAF